MSSADAALFRIWLVRYDAWEPRSWSDIPPHCQAVELAEPVCLTAREADFYREGFNSAMLGGSSRMWAVAVPVKVRYEDELPSGLRTA